MKVLVACEFSGVVRDAFISSGHDAISCDLLPSSSEGPHIVGDVTELLREPWDLVIAHPPCTYLCVTGNRHYAGTEKRQEAIVFFSKFLEANSPRICVENPVGVISTSIRPPDQYIQPWQFGHKTTKKTGLWLKGLPKLVPTNIVEPDEQVSLKGGTKMSKWYYETSLLPKDKRGHARSITFKGIAEAMAEQWG